MVENSVSQCTMGGSNMSHRPHTVLIGQSQSKITKKKLNLQIRFVKGIYNRYIKTAFTIFQERLLKQHLKIIKPVIFKILQKIKSTYKNKKIAFYFTIKSNQIVNTPDYYINKSKIQPLICFKGLIIFPISILILLIS